MTIQLAERRIILRFKDAVVETDPDRGAASEAINLTVYGGALILIRFARPELTARFADVCCGLSRPLRGTSYFLGTDWKTPQPDQRNAMRGRIGRVFATGNWIEHLPLTENILIPQLHHTRRSVDHIRDEAAALAEFFGLPGLPSGLPGDFVPGDLQRAACVRAFLGLPWLILLEEPTAGMGSNFLFALIHAIRRVRDRGAAVIWMTGQDKVWNDASIPASYRYRAAARRLMEVKM
jgi:phospholipid/cholesterol/gamma-HCH transport system ATP-binding protein